MMRTNTAVFLATALVLILMTAIFVSAQSAEEIPPSPTPDIETAPDENAMEAPLEESPLAAEIPETEKQPESETEKSVPEWFGRFRDTPENAVAGNVDAEPPTKSPLPDPMSNLKQLAVKAMFTLCLLCGLFILAAYFFRKFASNSPLLAGPHLGKVLGKVYLDPKTILHYVHSGSRVLVIGVTRQQMTLITEFDAIEFDLEEEEKDSGAPKEMPFVNALDAALQQSQHDEDDIRTLRGDIERLREHLRDTVREKAE